MSRLLEYISHCFTWLLRASGLSKRPIPEPPNIPPPIQPTDPAVPNTPTIFYGPFIPQWGSFDYRELVEFDFRYQVHGCGDQAKKYGIKDPVGKGVTFELSVTRTSNQQPETILTVEGIVANGLAMSLERLYWVPGWSEHSRPPYFMPKRYRTKGCTTTPTPLTPPTTGGETYQLTLVVKAPNGQSWRWSEIVHVTGSSCS